MFKKSLSQRMQEFVKYHRDGDGECNTVVLCEWAERHKLNKQERYELAYFFAITYCVESAIVLFNDRKNVRKNPEAWVNANKEKLIFQSDRKYIRMKDSFLRCLKSFYEDKCDCEEFLSRVMSQNRVILKKAIPEVEKWVLFGRFSAFLFLEMFINLEHLYFDNAVIDWKNGNTATSGLLNLFGFDEAANAFDKTGKLPKNLTYDRMNQMLAMVIKESKKAGASLNVTEIETSLCAYRKLYKASRYNGFYLDRMLEELYQMQKNFPDISRELFEIRKAKFNAKYLGELGGWKKIRTEMKKLYREKGIIS